MLAHHVGQIQSLTACQAVKAILLLGGKDDFRITNYATYASGPKTMGRDEQWKKLVATKGLGFKSHHLLGEERLTWIIEVEAPSGKKVAVKANGGDMYASSWLDLGVRSNHDLVLSAATGYFAPTLVFWRPIPKQTL